MSILGLLTESRRLANSRGFRIATDNDSNAGKGGRKTALNYWAEYRPSMYMDSAKSDPAREAAPLHNILGKDVRNLKFQKYED